MCTKIMTEIIENINKEIQYNVLLEARRTTFHHTPHNIDFAYKCCQKRNFFCNAKFYLETTTTNVVFARTLKHFFIFDKEIN